MKNSWRPQKIKLVYNYLLSYLLMFMIPLSILGVFFYKHYNVEFRNEIIKYNQGSLQYTRNLVDKKISRIKEIVKQAEVNTILTPNKIKRSVIDEINAIKELKRYTDMDEGIDKTILYIDNHTRMYGPTTTYNIETFLNEISMSDMRVEEWQAFIQSIRQSTLITSDQKDKNQLLYIQPLPRVSIDPAYYLIIKVNTGFIESTINTLINQQYSKTVIINKDELLFTMGDLEFGNVEQIETLINNYVETSSQKIDNKKYLIVAEESEISNLKYITFIDYKFALEKFYKLNKTYLLLVLAFLVVGILSIYIFMKLNYRPIKKLKELSIKANDLDLAGADKNELEIIEYNIEQVALRELNLKTQIEQNKPTMRLYLMRTILQGEIKDAYEVETLERSIDIAVKYRYYRVLIVEFAQTIGSEEKKDTIEALIRDNLKQEVGLCWGEKGVLDHAIVFILGNNILDNTVSEKTLDVLEQQLGKIDGCSVYIGLGKIYDTIKDIKKSYIEALIALEQKNLSLYNKIIYYEEIIKNYNLSFISKYVEKIISKLEYSFKKGDLEEIDAILEQIKDKFMTEQLTLLMMKCICYRLLNTLIKVSNEYGINLSINEVNYFVGIQNSQEAISFLEQIKYISRAIGEEINKLEQGKSTNLKESILIAINNSCFEPSFSAQIVADGLNISQSYLSRYFKKELGYTLMDYVIKRRIERAKELLKESGKSIKVIALEVGYLNEISFVRAFKKIEGIPPGEYRKSIQAKK